MADEKFHTYVRNIILVAIPVVIVITILIGLNETLELLGLSIDTYDYVRFYVRDWLALLSGENPYHFFYEGSWVSSYYPIGFQSFSGLAAINILAPKVVFCVIWIYTAYFINQLCKKYGMSRKSTIYFCFALIILNPVYLGATLFTGHDDVVVGLCILLAIYFIDRSKEIKSGLAAAYAFLVKFVGLIIIFPIVFLKRKLNWRAGLIAGGIIGAVYLIGYLIWGPYVFWPFQFQFFRAPEEGSILLFLQEVLGIYIYPYLLYILIAGAIFVAIFLYFQNTDVASFALILVLCFLIISPIYFIHYGEWFIPLAIYWCIMHGGKLQGTIFYYHVGGLIAALVSYLYYAPYGAVVMAITTALYALVIFFNRNKEMGESLNKEASTS